MDSYTATRLRRRRSSDSLPLFVGLGSVLALVIAAAVYWKHTQDQQRAEAAAALAAQQTAQASTAQPAPPTRSSRPAPTDTAAAPAADRPASRLTRPAPTPRGDDPADDGLAANTPAYTSNYEFSSTSAIQPRDAAGAVDRIAREVHDALELRKTLVVWLFDRSPSNEPLRKEVIDRVRPAWEALIAKSSGSAADSASADPAADRHDAARLLTTVVAYGDEADFLLQDPTDELSVFSDALDRVKTVPNHVENTFAAVAAVTERYLPYRAQKGRNLIIVVVSDEVGDDGHRVDEVLAPLTRYSVPVNVIGISAMFGRRDGMAYNAEGGADNPRLPPRVVQGPDSRDVDWVNIDYPSGGESLPTLQTGIGPYALTRLCQETGGTYFALPQMGEGMRAAAAATSSMAGGSAEGGNRMDGYVGAGYWSNLSSSAGSTLPDFGSSFSSGPTDPNFVRRYAPKYMPEQQYQQMVSSNRAMQALVEAAKLPRAEVFTGSTMSFSAEMDEARRARAFDTAQRPAARVIVGIDAMYNVLRNGEADRAKLTDPRWQAAFDLAIGRVMAAKVRADGYVNLVAILKNGRNFENEGSTTWVFEPANEYKLNSTLDRMSQKAREYLEGVIKDHPNTPWAEAAQRELQSPIGWRMVER